MKITFIGTGHGVPEAHKQCSSTLIEINDKYYFIDAGCDVAFASANRRLDHDKIKAFFITHPHHDHIDGLYSFLGLISWYYEYKTCNPAVVFPNDKCKNFAETYLSFFGNKLRSEQIHTVAKAGIVYDDETLRVTAFPTKHCPDSFAYLLEAENKRILFTGDLQNPKTDFPNIDDLDAAIIEGVHFSLLDYVDVLSEKNIGAVYVNHYANYLGNVNVERFKQMKEALPHIRSYITSDGMEINV